MLNKEKKSQEQLLNRILINIGIAVLAFIFLYVMYAKYYMMPSAVFMLVFFALAVVGYILSAAKVIKVKNYAHMFLAFGFCMMFTNLSKILGAVMGMERFTNLIKTSDIFKILVNTRYEVIILTWLGVVYLVGMLIYNTVLINKAGRK